MKEPHGEGLASHADPESCAGTGNGAGEALTGAHAGQELSREMNDVQGADAVGDGGRRHRPWRERRVTAGPCVVADPVHAWKHLAREPGDPAGPSTHEMAWWSAPGSQKRTPAMYGRRESDRLVVPGKRPNKAGSPAAEGVEGRGLTKGNLSSQNTAQAQDWK